MWTQEHLQGCNRGSFQNASVPDSRCWLRPHLRGDEHGKYLGPFFAGPDIWGQGSLSVLSLWKKLAWFSAETETWVRRICRGLDEGHDLAWSR